MKIFLVGGAVRDTLLNIPTSDKDYVVVGSTEEEMLSLGYTQVGKGFPVFLHPITKEEYALARSETKVSSGYLGFTTSTKEVSLEEDLLRRDLTINAMAMDEKGNLIDYCGGEEDLQLGILRHASPAFIEDPLRILRVARFAAKFKQFGFKVAHNTHKLMCHMVERGEFDTLPGERIFTELRKALEYKHSSVFFKILLSCGAYNTLFGTHEEVHTHNTPFTHLDLDAPAPTKFALWLHDYDLTTLKNIAKILKVPKKFSELAIAAHHFIPVIHSLNILTQEPRANRQHAITFGNDVYDDTIALSKVILKHLLSIDSMRNPAKFEGVLEVAKCAQIDIASPKELHAQLLGVSFDTSAEDGILQLQQQRLQIIQHYVG